jgi:protein arginine kinase
MNKKAICCWRGEFEDVHALLRDMACSPVPWLNGEGEENDIIISSRVRLARNLKDFSFERIENKENLLSILKTVTDAIRQVSKLDGFVSLKMHTLSITERSMLMERRHISPNFIRNDRPRGAVIGPDEEVSLMINEEDHIRIQTMQPALGLFKAWKSAQSVDNELSQHLDYSFSDQFGYLTACPTNVGTGLRASIFIHLPALYMAGKIQSALNDISGSEVAIRGFYGEGSGMLGDIYQISNQLTLGRVEQKIIDRMQLVAEQICDMERRERKALLRKRRLRIEDRINRARAIVQIARLMESRELLQLLSDIRLGLSLGLIERIQYPSLNKLIVMTQPAHLQMINGNEMNSEQRDEARANYVKEELSL